MSRFDRPHHAYEYDYTGGRSFWDTRTFIGIDDDDDNDVETTDHYSRATLGRPRRRSAAPASVIGYGDLEFRPWSTATTTTATTTTPTPTARPLITYDWDLPHHSDIAPSRTHRDRDRDRRGYQVVATVDARQGSDGGGVGGEELRFGVGSVREKLPNPRVPSGHRRRRRSESWERVKTGRKTVSSAVGGRTASSSKFRGIKPQYNQVHALLLTWSFHDLRAEDYTAPPAADYVSLEEETARLRATLESYGYTVHEFLIPMHRSVESLKAKLKQFCRYAADDTLLMVYYHGHGAMDDDNELVFSSERYRPVSTLKWDHLRTPILSAPCDVFLILDCCAAGGAGLRHLSWQPPPGAEAYTK
ncbi:hypothetical protein F5144DRAFT_465135, partial [Chaetomium tenue]